MSYTDAQLKDAAAIAYGGKNDFISSGWEVLSNGKTGEQPPFSFEQLYNASGASNSSSGKMFSDIDSDVSQWKILDVYNNNDETGFWGCVIDPGDGNLIVAFRGSENMLDMKNSKDWVEADFLLLNNVLTDQQRDAYAFMKQIANSDYIDKYDSIALTGHSLGGNLAQYSTVIASEFNLDDKVIQCVSFDAPNFSLEFIAANREAIEAAKHKIVAYSWSIVGGLLHPLPGVKHESLAGDMNHSLTKIVFDEDGNAIRGEADVLTLVSGYFSRGWDRLPAPIGNALVGCIGTLFKFAIWQYNLMFEKDGNGNNVLTEYGQAVTVLIVALVFTHFSVVVAVVYVVVVLIALVLIGITVELLYELHTKIVAAVGEVLSWTKEKISEIIDYISQMYDSFKTWLNQSLNAGYRYADMNPQIVVNTPLLRSYAERLQCINKRTSSMDSRMDSLYWSVGLLDLWNLMQANLLIKDNRTISKCVEYLYDTAHDFETSEVAIESKI